MVKDRIFSPAFGNRPRQLIGREEIIRQYMTGLKSVPGSKERAVVFLGQRGTGKTVLLLELEERAEKEGYLVVSPTITASGMLDRIVEKLQEEGEICFRKSRVKLTGGSFAAFGFSAGLPGAVFHALNDKVLTFFNRAKKVELGALKTGDVDAYYRQAFRDMKISVPDDIRRKAAEAAQGSPYLMQLIGHYVTIEAHENQPVSQKDLQAALLSAKKEFISDICQTTLHPLSEVDIRFLKAMAEDTETSRISDISRRMEVGADYIQIYKRRLIDCGVITQPGRGLVAFAVPYLRDYLRKEYLSDEQEFLDRFQELSEAQRKRLLVYMKKLSSL